MVENYILDSNKKIKQNVLIGLFTVKSESAGAEKQSDRHIGIPINKTTEIYQIGTLARVTHFRSVDVVSKSSTSSKNYKKLPYKYILLVQGIRRICVKEITQTLPYQVAQTQLLKSTNLAIEDAEWTKNAIQTLKIHFQEATKLIKSVGKQLVKRGQELLKHLTSENLVELVDIVASIVEASVEERMDILACLDIKERLELVNNLLQRQIEYFKVSQELQNKVQENLDSSRRKFYLRQQLKAIQKELGEDSENKDQTELEELTNTINSLNLTPEVEKVVSKDLHRLQRMQPVQPEYSVILNYLEFVISLPWEKLETEVENASINLTQIAEGVDGSGDFDNTTGADTTVLIESESEHQQGILTSEKSEVDLSKARKILDDDHFGLENVKERVLQYLAVCSLRKDTAGPILCFAGPPGVGKTSLGKSIGW